MITIKRPKSVDEKRLASINIYDIQEADSILDKTLQYMKETYTNIERKGKAIMLEDFATFDIETTTLKADSPNNTLPDPVAFPYSYQFYINGYTFILRNRDDFIKFMSTLSSYLQKKYLYLIVYVHNLSFEYQFLKSMLSIDDSSVFATDERSIMRFIANDSIEFRCSYRLSNMSLEKFTENYCTEEFRKDKELIDYEIERFPWTVLSDEILYYSAMDCITLYHAVHSIMDREQDNLKSIPMTNTGYVRRSLKSVTVGSNNKHYKSKKDQESYKQFKDYRKNCFLRLELNKEQYDQQLDAFRGGNTHANRFRAGQILDNVGSKDFSSSYPAIIMACDEFPMGKLMECTNSVQTDEDRRYYNRNYYVIYTAVLQDISLRHPDKTTVPYIPTSKVELEKEEVEITLKNGKTKKKKKNLKGIYDNGRIIEQKGKMLFTFLGCEYEIIKKQYKGKIRIVKAYYTSKGKLPYPIRKACFDWYEAKTALKGIDGKEYEYMKSKNRLNSIYGCMVEKIIKPILEAENGNVISRKPTDEEAEKQLADFYTPMKNKFLAYQWGVVITAMARVRLQEMIEIVGDDFVYADTDSCKYTNPEKYEPAFQKMNETWIKYASDNDVPVSAFNSSGDEFPIGIADSEHPYDRFVTLGAKKYAYEINHKLGITIAGVPKKAGAEMLGSLENFKPGFVFKTYDEDDNSKRQIWKKLLIYDDEMNTDIKVDGHTLHIGTHIAMLRTEYTLGISTEYADLTGLENLIYVEDIEVWNN